jgi:hypothetical protein
MNTHQRFFLVSVTLAAAAATPAFTQSIAPAVGSTAIRTPNTASIPDFSGIWGHPYLTGGFEQPLSGPGPVRNRARRRDGVSSDYQLIGDYTNPILKPQAAEEVRKRGLSDSKQPVLARTRTLYFSRFWNTIVTAGGPDHDPVFARS